MVSIYVMKNRHKHCIHKYILILVTKLQVLHVCELHKHTIYKLTIDTPHLFFVAVT